MSNVGFNKFRLNIVMPIYNGFRGDPNSLWMEKAIDSVFTSMESEHILTFVDNGSTDGTWEWLQKFNKHDNVNLIHVPVMLGGGGATNLGCRAINTEYITLVDCDDLTASGYFSDAVRFLDENDGFDMVGCVPRSIDVYDNNVELNQPTVFSDSQFRSDLFAGRCHNIGPVVRRDIFLKLGGYKEEYNLCFYAGDFDFYLRFMEKYKCGFLQRDGWITRVAHKDKPSFSDNEVIHNNLAALAFLMSYARRIEV